MSRERHLPWVDVTMIIGENMCWLEDRTGDRIKYALGEGTARQIDYLNTWANKNGYVIYQRRSEDD